VANESPASYTKTALLIGEPLRPFGHRKLIEVIADSDPMDIESLGYLVGRDAVLIELDDLSSDS
jgi:predicted transcriptional regulator